MPDDILDAAQKAINDAAGQSTPAVPPPPAPAANEPTQADKIVDSLLSSPSVSAPAGEQPSTINNQPTTNTAPPQEPVKPKKKSLGPLLAALLLLVTAIPLGVRFASQQQSLNEIRSRATAPTCVSPNTCVPSLAECRDAGGTQVSKTCNGNWKCCNIPTTTTTAPTCVSPNTCVPSLAECRDAGGTQVSKTCNGNWKCCNIPTTPAPSTSSDWGGGDGNIPQQPSCVLPPINTVCSNTGKPFKGQCAIYHCPQGCGGGDPNKCDENDPGVWISHAPCTTKLTAGECGQIDIVDENLTYCDTPNYCTVPQIRCNNCGGGGGGGTPETPQCNLIKLYKDGAVVTDYSTLKAGDAVQIAVAGGLATKARIRMNGAAFEETSTKNASGEYTKDLTIPEGVTSFTFEAEIFGTDGNWH